jgi:hypothetical protein
MDDEILANSSSNNKYRYQANRTFIIEQVYKDAYRCRSQKIDGTNYTIYSGFGGKLNFFRKNI